VAPDLAVLANLRTEVDLAQMLAARDAPARRSAVEARVHFLEEARARAQCGECQPLQALQLQIVRVVACRVI